MNVLKLSFIILVLNTVFVSANEYNNSIIDNNYTSIKERGTFIHDFNIILEFYYKKQAINPYSLVGKTKKEILEFAGITDLETFEKYYNHLQEEKKKSNGLSIKTLQKVLDGMK